MRGRADVWDVLGAWNAYAAVYDELLRIRPYRSLLEEVASALCLHAGHRVLSVGCGTGNDIAAVLAAEPGARVSGIDLSPAMLRRARRKLADRVVLEQRDLNQRLPFADGSFDGAVSVNALYAVDDPIRVLRELRRVVVRGGRVVVATLAVPRLRLILLEHLRADSVTGARDAARLMRAVIGFGLLTGFNMAIGRRARTGAFQLFTPEELARACERSGFRVERSAMTYADTCSIAVAIAA